MVTSTPALPLTEPGRLTRAVIAVLAATAWGGATSFLQLLPGTWNALANSVAGWVIPVALVLWMARLSMRPSAVAGAVAFVGMSLGYSLVSTLRGHPDLEIMWAAIGLVAGPVVGVATTLLREPERVRVSIGAGVLAGIVAGDAMRGLLQLPDYVGSWIVFAGCAALLVWIVATVRRLTIGNVATVLGVTVITGAAYQRGMLLLGLLV